MYLLELYYANARRNQTGRFFFPCRKGTIPKWTIFSSHPKDREKLQLMALAMAGTRYLPHIPFQQNHLLNIPNQPLQSCVVFLLKVKLLFQVQIQNYNRLYHYDASQQLVYFEILPFLFVLLL